MKITKIKIKNLFGIKEYQTDGKDIELSGKNGTGKTSVLDSIRYALTNKSDRTYIVRDGESEGEIIIETDTDLQITRKKRNGKVDYKSVKNGGHEVASPETFLKDIFTPLQLNPIEFMEMDSKKQNAIILDMIDFKWDMSTIKEWFGEIPSWINYEQNILNILNDIQSEKGEYYLTRQDINRDIRNQTAFIEEINATLPTDYQVAKWESANTGDLWRKIERIRKENEEIETAKNIISNYDNKIRSFEAEKEIAFSAIEQEYNRKEKNLNSEIVKLKEQISVFEQELSHIGESKTQKKQIEEEKFKASVSKFDSEIEANREKATKEIQDTSELIEEVEYIEKMQRYINEYRRMEKLQKEVSAMQEQSALLTSRIEKARELPSEILKTSNIPVKGLRVKDGIPLINGLPISNLSDGEKLDLCIDVATQNAKGLQIILIDGVEKMSNEKRSQLYAKCKEKGLQFISTRTTDDNSLTVVEL